MPAPFGRVRVFPVPTRRVGRGTHWNAKPILGLRFGRLTVEKEVGRNGRRSIVYECACDCGNHVVRVGSTLLCGKSRSCGCTKYSAEAIAKRCRALKPGCPERRAYYACRHSAQVRHLEFLLTLQNFLEMASADCAYCGSSPSQVKKTRYETFAANGIDRVDNSTGYTVENCVPCCRVCNFMKRDMSAGDFLTHVQRILSFRSRSASAEDRHSFEK